MKEFFLKCILMCFLSGFVFADVGIDNMTLQRYLENNFNADESIKWNEIDSFMKRFSVTNDQLYDVLITIYNKAVDKQAMYTSTTQEHHNNGRLIEGVLTWIPKCENKSVKAILMDYAIPKDNDSLNRTLAVLSYLRIADADEAKEALLRFLVNEDRMNGIARLSLYSHAQTVYEQALLKKKAAILAALLVAAQKEEGKIEFMMVDKILSERSTMYRQSLERLRLLEQHSKEPPTTNLYTDRDLKAALDEARSYSGYTILGTNLAALALLDSPQLHQIVPSPAIIQREMDKKIAKRRLSIIGSILVAGLATATGFWVYRRKRKA